MAEKKPGLTLEDETVALYHIPLEDLQRYRVPDEEQAVHERLTDFDEASPSWLKHQWGQFRCKGGD